ncbi:TetR family transcriptional regulator [Streptomyces sp. V2]|uniref:TetR/AcrR family transcriptional regulator n=1 Tax=Streptomyces sp. V2 TaxID=1424099 RepID=UPI000D66EE98|nr:TetR/AcrR family transcriptional regulator [Streptomyces sp. V2]PWG09080.1 TetR family transcriptional regulator [Streptomyces sp. V2]
MTQVKPMRADARRNYERLLKAAAEAFAEHGEHASLDDIAKRAGVGSGTLYRHFPTRQALLEAAYLDRMEALGLRADELGDGLPPGRALAEWLHELCVVTIQVRGMRALLGSAVTGANASVCGTRMKEAAGRLVERAQEAGFLRGDLSAVDVLLLAHGVATAAELGQEEGQVGRYVEVLVAGMRA